MKGIIFDLDGTLVDSLRDISDAVNRVLIGHGFQPHTLAHYATLIGEGASKLVDYALPEDQRHRSPELLLALRDDYGKNLVVHSRPYAGVTQTLTALERGNVPMAILSNKPHAMTQQVVATLLNNISFKCVFGQRAQVPRKPDPTAAYQAASAMGLAANQCIFVGDTKTDMQTARAAGMQAVGVSWGFRDREELIAHGAATVIDRPAQLLQLLQP